MLRLAAASSSRVAGGARAFKTVAKMKEKEAASKAALKATGGRDPYGLFKEAIASTADEKAARAARLPSQAHTEQRKEYSRAKMLERHRVDKHFTQMIKVRDAAIAALPEELQLEAKKPDHTIVPIERRVFTETAPIPGFQEKLQRRE